MHITPNISLGIRNAPRLFHCCGVKEEQTKNIKATILFVDLINEHAHLRIES